MSTVPAARRHDLPATPLTRADVPPGERVRLGTLVRFVGGGAVRRPFVSILVPCKRCQHPHRYPWRGDWPATAEVVSHQAGHCPRKPGPVWLALDPSTLAASVAVLEEAQAAFREWKAGGGYRSARGSPVPGPEAGRGEVDEAV